jgi:hypothetical protein
MANDFARAVESVKVAFTSVGWNRASGRLGVSLLIVSALFFAANFADKAWVSYQAGQQKQERMVAIGAVSAQIQTLRQQLVFARSRTYYMQQAEKYYGYVQPGDIELQLNLQPVRVVGAADQPLAMAMAKPTARTNGSLLHRLLQAVVPGL